MSGEIARLKLALTVLRMGINGKIDSEDADALAYALENDWPPINWDKYAGSTENVVRDLIEGRSHRRVHGGGGQDRTRRPTAGDEVMIDIVDQMRVYADEFPINDTAQWIDFASLYLSKGADEIERLREEVAWHVADKDRWQSTCCFCGKHQDFVEKLVQSQNSSICNECIELASDMVKGKTK